MLVAAETLVEMLVVQAEQHLTVEVAVHQAVIV
jgi:hypothetical protein